MVDCILYDVDINHETELTLTSKSNKTLWKPVLESATNICLKEIFNVFPTIFQKLNDQLQNRQCKLKYTSLSNTEMSFVI